MNDNLIIQEGEIAKFQLAITRPDFDLAADPVTIVLTWGFSSENVLTITRDNLYFDEEGRCFFAFDTTGMCGRVTARCTYSTPDSDRPTGYRTDVDRQPLCFVATTTCTNLGRCRCAASASHYVTYTRILRSDAGSVYLTVRTVDGTIVRTSAEEPVRVHKEEKDMNY